MQSEKMMEKGLVVETDGEMAKILFKRSSSCGNCKACGMLKDMSEMTIDLKNSVKAKEGDHVLIEFTAATALGSSAIAYIFPLIMLFIGVGLGYLIGKDNGDTADLYAAIGGLVMTALAFLVIKLFEPMFSRKFDKKFKMLCIAEEEAKDE